ncbi:MAG TPA: thioredoxin domain-containing protein [Pyrinomonadaceae bacterium]|nr:thioredoxin domain-containing protein [Pyrinomonadaceae bacterium]
MSKTKEAKSKVVEPKSNAPLLIIAGVLLAAILGGWYLYSSGKSSGAANSNSAANRANTAKTSAIPPNAPPGAQPPNQAGSPVAAVKIEEFADYQCGACATAHPVLSEIKSMYGSRIHFVFRNFPLDIHDKAYDAAVAAEAAGLQGKFWDMQNLLFTNQQAWTAASGYKATFKGYAEKIGLDVPKWETDMAGLLAKNRVDEDKKRARALGVGSTPTLYVNGNSIPFTEMNVQALKGIIDAELAKAAPPAQGATAPSAPTNAAK